MKTDYVIVHIKLVFLFLLQLTSGAKVKTTSCGLKKLRASSFMREFTSPGYPGEFPEQTQCTWLIEAPEGFRVKVKIRDFQLVKQSSDCKMQYLLFTDDYTGKMYGPLCGKMPKDEIISSANTLRIKLESDSVDVGVKYRGFKFLYTQTNEQTTQTLRDKAGLWRKYFVPSATLAPSPEPTDDTVDVNDNNSINRRNQIENLKNDKINEERQVDNFVPETKPKIQKIQPTVKTTTHPGRWVPKRKVKRPIIVKTRRPPSRPVYPGYRNVPKSEEKESESGGTSAAKYVAIIVAVLLIAAVVIFAAYKIRRRQKLKEKKGNVEELEVNTISKTIASEDTEKQIHVPEKYHPHSYEVVVPKHLELPTNTKFSRNDETKHSLDPHSKEKREIEHKKKKTLNRDINDNERGKRQRREKGENRSDRRIGRSIPQEKTSSKYDRRKQADSRPGEKGAKHSERQHRKNYEEVAPTIRTNKNEKRESERKTIVQNEAVKRRKSNRLDDRQKTKHKHKSSTSEHRDYKRRSRPTSGKPKNDTRKGKRNDRRSNKKRKHV